MPRFSANLSMLFPETAFIDRFARAAEAGFDAVECMFPYAHPAGTLAGRLADHGLRQVLFNLPAGDWAAGERGIACLPGREAEFREGVRRALAYAAALDCPRLNCLAGLVPPDADADRIADTLADNLLFAADRLQEAGVRLLLEPLNTRDVPGFFLTRFRDALALIDSLGHPNIAIQCDVYHMQVMEGDLIRTITGHMERIGHIQIADNPGRHEPGTGEIHFDNLFRAIDASGYTGWIGCEYIPQGDTAAGLSWLKPHLPA